MNSRKNQLKSVLLAVFLSVPLFIFNSCQTSEDEVGLSSEQLFSKESKIVSLLLEAVGSSADDSLTKNVNEEGCTEFVYPLTFYVYESDADIPAERAITSDEELIDLLEALTSGQQFFIMYPVTLVDVDGVETVITDYPDLEGILTMLVDACTGGDDDGDDEGDDDDSIDYEYCGNNNKKVIICHKGKSICISINAIWGHMAHHSEDYLGSCNN